MNGRYLSRTVPPRTLGSRGFTLLELVITMAVVAILASIAIPAYNSYILKSHRTDAKTALLDMASMEERFFSTNNIYSQSPADLGYSQTTFPIASVGNGYYSVSQTAFTAAAAPTAALPSGTPAYYQFTATPINTQVSDTACTSFTLDSKGVQGATGSQAATCWN
jgi:type IV pilus assembly protein PilE